MVSFASTDDVKLYSSIIVAIAFMLSLLVMNDNEVDEQRWWWCYCYWCTRCLLTEWSVQSLCQLVFWVVCLGWDHEHDHFGLWLSYAKSWFHAICELACEQFANNENELDRSICVAGSWVGNCWWDLSNSRASMFGEWPHWHLKFNVTNLRWSRLRSC